MGPDLKRIPPTLKDYHQWVCWRAENKIPVNPKTGRNARPNDPATWGSFTQAVSYWQAHKDVLSGIGFVFSIADPYTGVDLDRCRDPKTGEIEPWAKKIIDRAKSYTEISPSGTGFHIIIMGTCPPGGNKKGQVEIYSQLHYFTVTGLHLAGTSLTIEPRQAELEALHTEIFGKPTHPKDTGPVSSPPNLSNQEVLDLARRAANAEKFRRLWDGKWEGDYPSQSEATAALLNILVFYCGPNPAQIDRLFRRSELMRDKWDRPTSGSTWGGLEIQKAINRKTEFYTPPKLLPSPQEKEAPQHSVDKGPRQNPIMKPIIANIEAEQAVLGAILIQPEVLSPIAAILSPQKFYREAHRRIFQAMLDLQRAEQPVDRVTVTLRLRERGELEGAGGPAFLASLNEQVGFAVNGPAYAQAVHERYVVRELAFRARSILEKCVSCNGEKVSDLVLYAESQIQDSLGQLEFTDPQPVSGRELLSKDFSQATPVIGGGLLPAGCNLMIAGESGEGKSMLRLELSLYIAMGRDFLGLEIPQPRRVLIIQFENSEQIEQVRLKRMLKGLKADCPENLFFSSPLSRFDLGNESDRARLIATIQKIQAEVVVYDPLSSLHRANENDNAQMREVLDNLTEINRRSGTTAMVVHHYGKAAKEEVAGIYRTRGASSIRDWADTLLGFSRKKHDELILRNLEFLKVRCGPEPKPLILARDKETFLHQVGDGGTICPPDKVRGMLEDFGGQAEREKLLRAIQKAVGCQERRARDFLRDAVNQGSIRVEDHPKDKRKKIYKVP